MTFVGGATLFCFGLNAVGLFGGAKVSAAIEGQSQQVAGRYTTETMIFLVGGGLAFLTGALLAFTRLGGARRTQGDPMPVSPAADAPSATGLLGFLRENLWWWLTPILVVIALLLAVVMLSSRGGGLAPFIYSIF